jgi:hypothetical protein
LPSNMYADAETWSPFVGCLHGCIYCKVSFQQQVKRWAKRNCERCYLYTPHSHLERLKRVPSSPIVFVCGDGDIAFCESETLKLIADRLKLHSERCPGRTYYFQSKDWSRAGRVAPLVENIKGTVVLETLETNRDGGYSLISRAPPPTVRHKSFLELSHPRKAITAEPLLDFDVDGFYKIIVDAEPEFVWIGYNSKPHAVQLPEPSVEKTARLIKLLRASGVDVRGKNLKGLEKGGGWNV